MTLFVRTGSGGLDPAVLIRDLGITIPTGAGWTELTYYNSVEFGNGQYTPEKLASSENLYNFIKDGTLEASSDGISNNIPASQYSPSYPLAQAAIDGYAGFDLSDARLVLPVVVNPDALSNPPPRLGEIVYDSTDGYVEFYDGAIWQVLGAGAGGGGAGATELGQLTDVDLTTAPPFIGAFLTYDGYQWVPAEGRQVYNKEIDETVSDTIYIGEALPGTATSTAAWRIQRLIFTSGIGGTEDISKTWADGNALFDNIWDNRLSLSYS